MRNCFQCILTQRLARIISFTCRDPAWGLHRVAVPVEGEVGSLALRGIAESGRGKQLILQRWSPRLRVLVEAQRVGWCRRWRRRGPRTHDTVLPLPTPSHRQPLQSRQNPLLLPWDTWVWIYEGLSNDVWLSTLGGENESLQPQLPFLIFIGRVTQPSSHPRPLCFY